MKKILFMGTPQYAKVVLESLYAHFEIVGVFTQPDKPVGRKMILTPPPVKDFAVSKNLKIFQPNTLKDGACEQIKALKPDFIVVAAYGQILGEDILGIAPCVNLHASILPKFRGASPIQDMILKGEILGGVTAMKMGVGLDDGNMLGFKVCNIIGKNSAELFALFADMAADLSVRIITDYNDILPLAQFDALSTKCKKIKKEQGKISLNDDINEIWRKFLAFSPWPGIFLENGTKLLDIKITKKEHNTELSKITKINQNSFEVSANGGFIEIFSLQEAGKKALGAKEYLNGKRLQNGSNF